MPYKNAILNLVLKPTWSQHGNIHGNYLERMGFLQMVWWAQLRKTSWDGDGTCSNKWRVKGVMCLGRCKCCPEAHLYYVLRLCRSEDTPMKCHTCLCSMVELTMLGTWDKSCIFGIPNLDVYDLPTITIIYIVWG